MNKKTFLNYAIIAICFFLLGMLLSPKGILIDTIKASLSYTKSTANRLYTAQDKTSLCLEDDAPFSEFIAKNDSFALYFWATWCPHCVNVRETMNSVAEKVPLIGIPFEQEQTDYDGYLAENQIGWQNVLSVNEGEKSFVQRTDAFAIPAIPSVWYVKAGKVRKIFVGEEDIAKLPEWLDKQK